MSVDLVQAIRTAKQAVTTLVGDVGGLMVEEVKTPAESNGRWEITIGFDFPARNSFQEMLGVRSRTFRVVEIDAVSGRVIGLKSLRNFKDSPRWAPRVKAEDGP